MLGSNENQPTPVTVPVSDAVEKIRGVETILNILRSLNVCDRPHNQRMNAVASKEKFARKLLTLDDFMPSKKPAVSTIVGQLNEIMSLAKAYASQYEANSIKVARELGYFRQPFSLTFVEDSDSEDSGAPVKLSGLESVKTLNPQKSLLREMTRITKSDEATLSMMQDRSALQIEACLLQEFVNLGISELKSEESAEAVEAAAKQQAREKEEQATEHDQVCLIYIFHLSNIFVCNFLIGDCDSCGDGPSPSTSQEKRVRVKWRACSRQAATKGRA